MQRINVLSGQIEKVLPENTGLVAFSYSPNENTLVYIEQYQIPQYLYFLHLTTGGEQKIELEIITDSDPARVQAGSFRWSPDGNAFIFFTLDDNAITKAHYFNMETSTYHSNLFPHFIEAYIYLFWLDNENILFVSYPYYEAVSLNLLTGETTTILPTTPTP